MTVAERAIVEGINVVGGVYYCGIPISGIVLSNQLPVQDDKKDSATALSQQLPLRLILDLIKTLAAMHFAPTDPQASNSAFQDTAN